MNSIARKQAVMKELQETGSANIIELAQRLNVSTMTIRRDLQQFAEEGLVTMEHGGAVFNSGSLHDHSMVMKQGEAIDEKRKIAKQCAELIRDGQSIFLDAGTTCAEIARLIASRRHITVITHSLLVANALSVSSDASLIMCPGVYREKSMAFMGQMTDEYLHRFKIDLLFLGVEGVDLGHGVSVQDINDGFTKKKLIEQADRVICAADSGKFGKELFCRIADLDQIDTIVTDNGLDEDMREAYAEKGVQLIISE